MGKKTSKAERRRLQAMLCSVKSAEYLAQIDLSLALAEANDEDRRGLLNRAETALEKLQVFVPRIRAAVNGTDKADKPDKADNFFIGPATSKTMRAPRRLNPDAGMIRFTKAGDCVVSVPSADTHSQVAYTWMLLEDEISAINRLDPRPEEILTKHKAIAALQPTTLEMRALSGPKPIDPAQWIGNALFARMGHHPNCDLETIKKYGRSRRRLREAPQK